MSALGDRRRRVRHEVVGALWGTLEVDEPARLVDVSPGGALVSVDTPRDLEAAPSLVMTHDGRQVHRPARVRYVRRASHGAYQVGLEFLSSAEPDDQAN